MNKPANTASKSQREPHALSKSHIMAVFTGLMIAMFVGSLDQTIVSTALPTIVGDLGGVDHMLWVTSAYMLASTVTMPLYGKLGDLYGRKYLFCGALVLFALGSIICGVGHSMESLIAGRAVQGLGGGGLMILSQSIIADIFPPKERGKYMGVMGAAFGVSAVLGPLLGGLFTDYLGWQWCFWINIPLATIAFATAAICLPKGAASDGSAPKTTFDVAGTATMAIATSCIVLALSIGTISVASVSLAVIAIIAAIVFVHIERQAENPLIPLSMFKNRTFCLATIAGMLIMVAMMGVISYMPTYIQITRGYGATISGYLLLPMMLGMMITSTLAGFAASKVRSVKRFPFIGSIAAAVACLLLSFMTIETSTVLLCVCLFLLGFGIGLGQQILVLMVQNEFPVSSVGTATGANNFFREIGATLGATIVGAAFTSNLAKNLAAAESAGQSLADAGIDANSITPSLVHSLDAATQQSIATAYNDALMPILLAMVPILIAAALLVFAIREIPLAESNEQSGHMNETGKRKAQRTESTRTTAGDMRG